VYGTNSIFQNRRLRRHALRQASLWHHNSITATFTIKGTDKPLTLE